MRKIALGIMVGASLTAPALAEDPPAKRPPANVKVNRVQGGGSTRAMNKTDGKTPGSPGESVGKTEEPKAQQTELKIREGKIREGKIREIKIREGGTRVR